MAQKRQLKVLLVDYEVNKMKATEEALSERGFEVVTAHDGLEALQQFTATRPDLVLLEAMLPKLHGFEVCKAIKRSEAGRDVPVIITTGVYKSAKYKRQAIKDYLADDYLIKPFDFEELMTKIRENLKPELAALIRSSESGPVAQRQAAKEADFEKLLNETLSDLLRSTKEPEVKPASPPEKSFEQFLEDTLSGLRPMPSRPAGKKPAGREAAPRRAARPAEKRRRKPEVPARRAEGEPRPRRRRPEGAKAEEAAARAGSAAAGREVRAEEEAARVAEDPAQASRTLRVPEPLVEPEEAEAREAAGEPTAEEGTPFGKYLLIERIALGGMAEMFKAKQRGVKGFEKLVAIKRILPHLSQDREFVKMFIDEAKLAAQLTHQNIAQIYELGKIDGAYYIAMEYIQGKDLRAILTRLRETGRKMPVLLAAVIASKVANGLHYAHRKKGLDNRPLKIVHRDISPQNVIISYEGEVKLVDFGIAKAAAKDSVTRMGAIKGKLLYMSPEQAWGKAIDHRSDIFSLGSLLFEMLTAERLFMADSEIAILEKVRNAEIPDILALRPDTPEELVRIMRKAIERDPEDRYQTAGEMKRDLDQFLFSHDSVPGAEELAIFMRRLFQEEISEELPELLGAREEESEAATLMVPVVKPGTKGEKEKGAGPLEDEEEAATMQVAPLKPAEVEEDVHEAPTAPKAPKARRETSRSAPGAKTETRLKARPSRPEPAREETSEELDLEELLKPPPSTWERLKRRPLVPAIVGGGVLLTLLVIGLIWGWSGGTPPPPPPTATPLPATPTPAPEASMTPSPEPTEVPTATPEVKPTRRPRPTPVPVVVPPTEVPTEVPPTATPRVVPPTSTPRPPTATPEPTVPKIKPGDFVEFPEVRPAAVKQVQPRYPPGAKRYKIEGYVVLEVLVDQNGKVEDARVLKEYPSERAGFGKAALKVIRDWEFSPARHQGVPVRTKISISIRFRLK
jgi:TonB family protein